MPKFSIQGYHGTNVAYTSKIKTNNFNSSRGDEHWLGDGAYFFVDGFPNMHPPEKAACLWAEAEAWNNDIKKNKYTRFEVIKVSVIVDDDKFLDLTTSDGIETFNYFKVVFFEDILRKSKVRFKSGAKIFRDGELINFMRNVSKVPIEAAMGYFYIKFKTERIFQVDYRTPNCTILAVHTPESNIDKQSINIISKHAI
jgi:hypothetical protein